MFRGSHSLTMDAKGRIAIPARFRDLVLNEYDGQVIVNIDPLHPCLTIYPLEEWEKVEAKILLLSDMDPQQSRLKRIFLNNANPFELDKNGRLVLPQLHRNHAKLEKQLMIFGKAKKMEIWSEALWMAQSQQDLLEVKSEDLTGVLQEFSW
jgi:MraZ protein